MTANLALPRPSAAPREVAARAQTAGCGHREPGCVERARSGDHEAFAHLYEVQRIPISRYVLAILRDVDDAEDVTAETFLCAWRDLAKLRDVDRFEAWLFRIARNRAMTCLARRRSAIDIAGLGRVEDNGRACPARELDDLMNAEVIRQAIAQLPLAQRQAVTMRYFNELPAAEIARRLGKNDQSVWALTYRALKTLRRVIDRER